MFKSGGVDGQINIGWINGEKNVKGSININNLNLVL